MTIIDIDGGTNNSSNTTSSTDWIGWKERGTQAFNRADYDVALQAYAQATHQGSNNTGPSTLDRQILLSNMVACRLKLGGKAQAEAAVVTAKKCIALNDKWAKAHVRLGSAYIMLGGDESTYSNDACNALQLALQLSGGNNPTARDMLVRELRSRDRRHNSSSNSSSSSTPSPSAPPQHMDSQEYSSPGSASADNSNRNGARRSGDQNQTQNQDERHNQQQPQDHEYNNIDESNSISWRERIQFQIQRGTGWYSAQSEGIQTVLKMFLVLVVLYVAFGGRFGLDYIFNNNDDNSRTSSGKYSTDNSVYEEFYRDRNQRNQQQDDRHYRQDEDYSHQQNRNHRNNYDSSSSYDRRRSSSHSSSSWWDSSGTSSLLSGQYSHMLIIGGVVFVANRLGISPYQAIFFVNMLMGRRGGGGRRRGGFGGPGMMGGFGNMRHRPGGMWR